MLLVVGGLFTLENIIPSNKRFVGGRKLIVSKSKPGGRHTFISLLLYLARLDFVGRLCISPRFLV